LADQKKCNDGIRRKNIDTQPTLFRVNNSQKSAASDF
jgi:hypothetical protein